EWLSYPPPAGTSQPGGTALFYLLSSKPRVCPLLLHSPPTVMQGRNHRDMQSLLSFPAFPGQFPGGYMYAQWDADVLPDVSTGFLPYRIRESEFHRSLQVGSVFYY